MEHEVQAGKNFAWITISQIILRILGLAFFIFISNRLGEEGVGQYGFISSFVLFWFLVLDFGAGNFLYREWSKKTQDEDSVHRDFNLVFTLRLLIPAVLLAPFIVVNRAVNPEVFLPSVVFFFSMVVGGLLELCDIFLRSRNMFKQVAVRQVLDKIVMVVIGSILLVLITNDVLWVFVATLCAQLVVAVYYARMLPFSIKPSFDYKRFSFLISKGAPFLFLVVFTSIYSRIDMVMLKYMGNFEAVGLYNVAYRFFDLSLVFSAGLLLPAVFPVLSSLYGSGTWNKEIGQFFYKLLRIIFSFGLLVTLSIIFYSPIAISYFFPETFGGSILALRILIIAHIFMGVSVLFSNMLIIQNKEKKGLYIIIFSACANVVLNVVLISKYSLYGAAWATVIAEVLNIALLQYFLFWKKDLRILSKMTVLVLLNTAVVAVLSLHGLMNNLFIGTALLLLNVFMLSRMDLLTKDDSRLFLTPFKNKFKSFASQDI